MSDDAGGGAVAAANEIPNARAVSDKWRTLGFRAAGDVGSAAGRETGGGDGNPDASSPPFPRAAASSIFADAVLFFFSCTSCFVVGVLADLDAGAEAELDADGGTPTSCTRE